MSATACMRQLSFAQADLDLHSADARARADPIGVYRVCITVPPLTGGQVSLMCSVFCFRFLVVEVEAMLFTNDRMPACDTRRLHCCLMTTSSAHFHTFLMADVCMCLFSFFLRF